MGGNGYPVDGLTRLVLALPRGPRRAALAAECAAEEAERAVAETEEGQATETGGNPLENTQDAIGSAGASEPLADNSSDSDSEVDDDNDPEYVGPQTRGRKRKRIRVEQLS
ncbi:hypothetical protein DFH08DRAFT_818747 [Mycena albidolilacea]|uniref:Uncharacterized protein n=1 Tax=Mycena albidolilacea TaxID=1033008 RepID=A0AAD7EH90_9AGAR|nr:hypothetical protein DFH08DRAFT_818747 [Mycena albidolilacea]